MEPRTVNFAGVPEEFLKPYNSAESERGMISLWDKSGYANPDMCVADGITKSDAETYSIVLPPPNVTGILHLGSALMLAVEDILVRHARMNGKRTLWIPGTDSAAIATQSKVESDIYKKEKKTRHDLGREELLKRIDAFTEESKTTIINQMKKVGASLDWSRYAYTMDEKRYAAVMEAFVRMYETGLIYRGNRIVNWDPKSQTTVADDEIEYVEQKDPFYYFKYGPFVIGTVRPETKFGDKYVVMHPGDERYRQYTHGQKINLEWINGPITATIIKDEAADMEVGSGVMTITPAHSTVDFEIAERHTLDIEPVIDERGILLPIAGEFSGQHIKKARASVVEKLKTKGLVAKVDENYVHNVATNYRGAGLIEPQIKRQWFIGVNKEFTIPYSEIPGIASGSKTTLKAMMRAAVESGTTQILPDRYQKIYFHWIDNLRDWCISRQIWFGHRVPAWYRSTNVHGRQLTDADGKPNGTPSGSTALTAGESRGVEEEIYVGLKAPSGAGWQQDPDVLDTWFSSGLWTFSTLGWPEQTSDLKTYHPTSILETGYDILFFWVARMILMSGFLLGQVPFRKVYLHGLVRDGQGRKISKSLGNNIDPLDMSAKYGTDAVRISLIAGMAPGTDSKISEEKIRGYKHFANKVWNISRFVLESCQGEALTLESAALTANDSELRNESRRLAEDVSEYIVKFRLDLAVDALYHFIWDRFAAEIIEESKSILRSEDVAARASRARLLYEILTISLKLLHPFMPFVTEAIWQKLPTRDSEILMVAKWPTYGSE